MLKVRSSPSEKDWDLIPDALLNPPISWYGNVLAASELEDRFVKYTYPEAFVQPYDRASELKFERVLEKGSK
jgi:hypothetical protein